MLHSFMLLDRVVHAPDLGFCSNLVNFRARFGDPKFVIEHFRGRESTYLEEYIVPVWSDVTQLRLGAKLQHLEVGKKSENPVDLMGIGAENHEKKCKKILKNAKKYFFIFFRKILLITSMYHENHEKSFFDASGTDFQPTGREENFRKKYFFRKNMIFLKFRKFCSDRFPDRSFRFFMLFPGNLDQ